MPVTKDTLTDAIAKLEARVAVLESHVVVKKTSKADPK